MDISKHSSYKDFVWAVELTRFGLELIGLWPKINDAVDNNFMSDLRVSIVFVIVTILSVIPLIWGLIRVWGDMILMIDNLQVTLPLLVVPLKLIVIRWKRTAVSVIVNMMAEDWIDLKTDVERDVMLRRARIARLIGICGHFAIITSCTVIIILPIFGLHFRHPTNLTDRNRLLPLPTYYFYDTDKSPQFELTFFVQALTMFLSATTYTSVDTFLGLIVFHICGQLENFRHRLVNLVSCSKDFDSALRNNILFHQRLIRFADNIEDMFNIMMLGLVFYFGIIFCLYGFLFFTVFKDEINHLALSRICFAVGGIFIILSHTFLFYGAGEILEQQCETVYRDICDLTWYKLEPRKARNLIILMIRANEPFHITAGKIFPFTMATFCSLLKTSAGYISFLLAKREIEA